MLIDFVDVGLVLFLSLSSVARPAAVAFKTFLSRVLGCAYAAGSRMLETLRGGKSIFRRRRLVGCKYTFSFLSPSLRDIRVRDSLSPPTDGFVTGRAKAAPSTLYSPRQPLLQPLSPRPLPTRFGQLGYSSLSPWFSIHGRR